MTNPFIGAGTGIGSWPGTDAREATKTVIGELPDLAHLVELPARGVGADLIGRAAAILVDIYLDTAPRGYRIVGRPGVVTARAKSFLAQDIDYLEEAWERAGLKDSGRSLKVQSPGPFSFAAEVELRNGHRVLTDVGAMRDIGQSLAEGVMSHCKDLERRLGANIVVQINEPLLPQVLEGSLQGVSILNPVAPLGVGEALESLNNFVAQIGRDILLHCEGDSLPWGLLAAADITGVGIDVARIAVADFDGVGEFIQSGKTMVLGLIPFQEPERVPSTEELARPVLSLLSSLGFSRKILSTQMGVSPVGGLALADQKWARTALTKTVELARIFSEEPEAL
ncbi:MAG: methionine synthase [Mycobacteriaceae bacterium]